MPIIVYSSQLEVANVPYIVAVPQITIMDRYAVDERILLRQLDLFHDLAGLPVVAEERSPVGIGDPERVSFPTNAMGAIPGRLPHRLDFPKLGVEHIHTTRRQDGEIQQPVAKFHSLAALASRPSGRCQRHLAWTQA